MGHLLVVVCFLCNALWSCFVMSQNTPDQLGYHMNKWFFFTVWSCQVHGMWCSCSKHIKAIFDLLSESPVSRTNDSQTKIPKSGWCEVLVISLFSTHFKLQTPHTRCKHHLWRYTCNGFDLTTLLWFIYRGPKILQPSVMFWTNLFCSKWTHQPNSGFLPEFHVMWRLETRQKLRNVLDVFLSLTPCPERPGYPVHWGQCPGTILASG